MEGAILRPPHPWLLWFLLCSSLRSISHPLEDYLSDSTHLHIRLTCKLTCSFLNFADCHTYLSLLLNITWAPCVVWVVPGLEPVPVCVQPLLGSCTVQTLTGAVNLLRTTVSLRLSPDTWQRKLISAPLTLPQPSAHDGSSGLERGLIQSKTLTFSSTPTSPQWSSTVSTSQSTFHLHAPFYPH